MRDQRSVTALDVAERFVNGAASAEELACAAYAAADAYADAADAAAYAAAAAAAAAADAAADAYAAAAYAADAAAAAADAMREKQENIFIKMCRGEAPWQKGAIPC